MWIYGRYVAGSYSLVAKLVAPTTGPDQEIGLGGFGYSVSLSANGQTALIGGPDDGTTGAAWVYTLGGGGWTEQAKLVPMDFTGSNNFFGGSVSLSSDGATALIGAADDGGGAGAAWVYILDGNWGEDKKLIGPTSGPDAEIGGAGFGASVSLDSVADRAIIGGPFDNDSDSGPPGAAWIFDGTFGVFSESVKLVPSDETGGVANFGSSAAIAPDGNSVLVGGPADNNQIGAAWQYTFAGGSWTEAQKLTVNDASGTAEFGQAVALSANNVAAIGGPGVPAVTPPDGQTWMFGGPYIFGPEQR